VNSRAGVVRSSERSTSFMVSTSLSKPPCFLLAVLLELLLVPQFTLAADTRKGTRASFTRAASPEVGSACFDRLVSLCRDRIDGVQSGQFGANMQVALTNDGPVTFWLES